MKNRRWFQTAGWNVVKSSGWQPRRITLLLTILGAMTLAVSAAIETPPAIAAECTTNWTGSAEGSWSTAGNWSTGKVPTSTDVACIGSGKTAKVTEIAGQAAVVQGEGSLKLLGTGGGSLELTSASEVSTISALIMKSGATLKGPGRLEVSSTMTLEGEAIMAGSGTTVLQTGATGSLATGESEPLRLKGTRHFINKGSFTESGSTVFEYEKAEFMNAGTFTANTNTAAAFEPVMTSEAKLINTGTLRRTVAGLTDIRIRFENEGIVDVEAGVLNVTQAGTSTSSAEWVGAGEGEVRFGSGYTISGGVVVGSVGCKSGTVSISGADASKADLTVSGTLQVTSGTLTADTVNTTAHGKISGAGTLAVSGSFGWAGEGEMTGTGETVVLPEATMSLSTAARIKKRHLVNEGVTTMTEGVLIFYEEASLRNKGTFNVNTNTVETTALITVGGGNSVVNNGLFQRTAGAKDMEISPNFENYGAIRETTSKLKFTHPVKVPTNNQFGKRCHSGDPVECATGDYTETQTDFAIGGLGTGLELTRTYSAQAAATASSLGAFGYGWTNSFGDRLVSEESGKKVTLLTASGSSVSFTGGPGAFTAPAWSQDSLSGSAEAGYTLTLPERIKYVFNGSGRLESVSDANGNKTTLSYDKSGRLEKIIDPAGRSITLTYNGEGLIEKAEDPIGRVVKYAYESKNLKSVTLPSEASPRWQFKYDASHRITSITDGRGGKTTNEYDSSSRVKSQTDPAGHTLTFEYSPFHTKLTNKATGSITDEWFTSNNEPFSITRGYGTAEASTETFAYDSGGRLVAATDGNGHTTTYAYNPQGDRTSEKDAEGNETKWSFNAAHELVSTTTPGGETTTIERDGNGNVESVSRPAPEETTQTTSFAHDEDGQLESVTDPLKRTWTYGYDVYGNRTSETDPLGNTQTLGYDKDSRITSIVTPRGNAEGAKPAEYETTIERDALGRPLKVTDPLGHFVKYAYDPNSNLESKTDANGYTTKYTYNADDEQIKVEKPNGSVLETEYDGEGNVVSQTDANERTTAYVRNALGQPIEVTDPLGRETFEEFDAAGNLKAVVDPVERETSYAYDKADRLIEVSYSDPGTPDAEFEYDPDGNVTKMVDGTGESTFGYDQLGRLREGEDGHGDPVGYGYDLAEELTAVAYPNGKGVSRTFDQAGRLESVTDWLGGTTTFSYDPDSNLETITFPLASGNVDEYAYDNADRMSAAKFASGAETLASLSYLRDKAGQVEEESNLGLPGAGSLAYGYDENERLVEAGEASFEYDPADNLTKAPGTTNAYDPAGQLETGSGVSYDYDKLGERTKTTPEAGPATAYGYDQAGDLISVERPEEGEVPAIEESLAYDATGLLASQTSSLTTRYFVWDSSDSLPLLLSDGENSYIYGPNGLAVEQISGEEAPSYLHHDQLGSTRMLTNAAGEETGAFSYGPFGSLGASTGVVTTPLGFTSQYADPQTGLQYLRARFYDPTTAQFLTRDPLAAVTRSPYGYGAENPLRNIDPSGLSCVNTTDVGPIPIPTSVSASDCVTEGVGTVVSGAGDLAGAAGDTGQFALDHASLIVAPFVFGFCLFEPEACTTATVVGIGVTVTADGTRAFIEPCFDLRAALIQDLLTSAAAALPGGLFEATAGRFGPPLTKVARRVLQALLDAPGLAAELVHGAAAH